MKISEYLDSINQGISIYYYHNQNIRWCASFEHAEIKEDGMLLSDFGNGDTPEKAVKKYIEMIKGKVLVFNVGDVKTRREFIVPETLEF